MNKELIDQFRLDAGIARLTAEWDKTLICVGKDGVAIDPLEGLTKFAELIVEECVRVVENEFWSDPHEVYQAIDLIKARFGVE